MNRTPAAGPCRSETVDLLHNRVSVRAFTAAAVDDALLETVLSAAFRAPTSSNIQAYSVIVVRDQARKDRLAVLTGNQRHVREAPVFLAFCADLTRIERALHANGHDIDDNNLEIGLVSSIDAALVGMSASLAAESLGLRGVMIGAVRNDAVAVARELGLPRRAYCVFGLCLGWAEQRPAQKPRMDYRALVHREQYGADLDDAAARRLLNDYDTALAEHYTRTGRSTTPDSWSHDMDKKFCPQLRDDLRRQLRELGFDFR